MLNHFVSAAAISIALVSGTVAARAEYPDRPVRYIVHVSPGGGTDIMARRLALGLEKVMGVPFVVENKAGGRGAAQLAELKAAKPDGYMIAAATTSHIGSFNQTLKQYNVDSFDWIARLVNERFLIAVKSDSKLKSMKDLVDAANANPGSVVMAGFVRGSGSHFAWEIMAESANLDTKKVRWVPYDSIGDAVTALVGGHAEVTIAHLDLVKTQVAAGNLRVIGVLSDERLPQLPDVPTLVEQGYKADTSWQQMRGVMGPKGMPAPIKAKLAAAIKQVLETPEFQSYMIESSIVPAFQAEEEFTAFVKLQDKQTKQWIEKLSLTR